MWKAAYTLMIKECLVSLPLWTAAVHNTLVVIFYIPTWAVSSWSIPKGLSDYLYQHYWNTDILGLESVRQADNTQRTTQQIEQGKFWLSNGEYLSSFQCLNVEHGIWQKTKMRLTKNFNAEPLKWCGIPSFSENDFSFPSLYFEINYLQKWRNTLICVEQSTLRPQWLLYLEWGPFAWYVT